MLKTMHDVLRESDAAVNRGLPKEVFDALMVVTKYFGDQNMRYWRAMGVCSTECLDLPHPLLKQCEWV